MEVTLNIYIYIYRPSLIPMTLIFYVYTLVISSPCFISFYNVYKVNQELTKKPKSINYS
jgi:hypothetical protein